MEYRPKAIVKVAGAKSTQDAAWAYVVDWTKNGQPDNGASDEEPEQDGMLLSQQTPSRQVRQPPEYGLRGIHWCDNPLEYGLTGYQSEPNP